MNTDDPIYRRARERALYLLDYRDHCYAEIVTKLLKNYDEEVAYAVADELADKGMIDDERYAESMARRLVEVKLYGTYRARQELRRRGVPKSIIEDALAEYEEGGVDRALELIERRYTRYLDPDDRREQQKLIAALVRSGYSFGEAKAALERAMAEIESE